MISMPNNSYNNYTLLLGKKINGVIEENGRNGEKTAGKRKFEKPCVPVVAVVPG